MSTHSEIAWITVVALGIGNLICIWLLGVPPATALERTFFQAIAIAVYWSALR